MLVQRTNTTYEVQRWSWRFTSSVLALRCEPVVLGMGHAAAWTDETAHMLYSYPRRL
jgi:hypothetical protein